MPRRSDPAYHDMVDELMKSPRDQDPRRGFERVERNPLGVGETAARQHAPGEPPYKSEAWYQRRERDFATNPARRRDRDRNTER